MVIYCSKTLSCYALCMLPPCCPVKVQDPKKGARNAQLVREKPMVLNMTQQAKVGLLIYHTKKLYYVVLLYPYRRGYNNSIQFLVILFLMKEVLFITFFLWLELQEVVSEFERVSKAAVLKNWDSSVTHVIASTDENGACRRTLKVLLGILEGKWILNIECKFSSFYFLLQSSCQLS